MVEMLKETRRGLDETPIGPIDLPETGANFEVDESVKAGKAIATMNTGLLNSPWSTFSAPDSRVKSG
jgi:hypothetical protein